MCYSHAMEGKWLCVHVGRVSERLGMETERVGRKGVRERR